MGQLAASWPVLVEEEEGGGGRGHGHLRLCCCLHRAFVCVAVNHYIISFCFRRMYVCALTQLLQCMLCNNFYPKGWLFCSVVCISHMYMSSCGRALVHVWCDGGHQHEVMTVRLFSSFWSDAYFHDRTTSQIRRGVFLTLFIFQTFQHRKHFVCVNVCVYSCPSNMTVFSGWRFMLFFHLF